ncbi:MAG TPA: hypothetical protein VH208_11035, partial [Myxococcaceae bacterium]|nr:hypothetical protein [Myxococcaceae bacterium]
AAQVAEERALLDAQKEGLERQRRKYLAEQRELENAREALDEEREAAAEALRRFEVELAQRAAQLEDARMAVFQQQTAQVRELEEREQRLREAEAAHPSLWGSEASLSTMDISEAWSRIESAQKELEERKQALEDERRKQPPGK